MKTKVPIETKRANKALFFAPQQINLSIMGRAKLAALAQALMLLDLHKPNFNFEGTDIAEPLIEYVDSRAADLLGEDILRSGAVSGAPMTDISIDESENIPSQLGIFLNDPPDTEQVIESYDDEPTEAEFAELEKLIALEREIAAEPIE